MCQIGTEMKEVVVATGDMVKAMPGVVDGGVYLAGTGDTGLAATFGALAGVRRAAPLLWCPGSHARSRVSCAC